MLILAPSLKLDVGVAVIVLVTLEVKEPLLVKVGDPDTVSVPLPLSVLDPVIDGV